MNEKNVRTIEDQSELIELSKNFFNEAKNVVNGKTGKAVLVLAFDEDEDRVKATAAFLGSSKLFSDGLMHLMLDPKHAELASMIRMAALSSMFAGLGNEEGEEEEEEGEEEE